MDEEIIEQQPTYKKYLTFAVGDDDYGLEIDCVTEIIKMQNITDMPELPDYMKGIINLRGKIIPVMDVRVRFKKEERAYDERTCIIVVEIDGTGIGLIVDTVRETLDIEDEDIAVPAEGKRGSDNKYIKGVGKTEPGIKLLIDLERVVADQC